MRRGHEPRLEDARRQAHARVEHRVEERRVAEGVLRAHLVEVARRALAEGDREEAADAGDRVGDGGRGSR